MSAKLTTREVDDVIIVDASGKLTLGEGSSALRQKMWELLDCGFRRFLLNLAEVVYLDSSGIGEVISAYTTVTALGGEMKLLNLTKRVRDLLTITKLSTVIDTYDDEASAVASFTPPDPKAMPQKTYQLMGEFYWG